MIINDLQNSPQLIDVNTFWVTTIPVSTLQASANFRSGQFKAFPARVTSRGVLSGGSKFDPSVCH